MQTDPWMIRLAALYMAGHLTALQEKVLRILRGYCRGGPGWPSHQTLADRARCSTRTVARAIAAAREQGMVLQQERRVRHGWRSVRTSNQYSTLTPSWPITPKPRTTRQKARVCTKEEIKQANEQWEIARRTIESTAACRQAMLFTQGRMP